MSDLQAELVRLAEERMAAAYEVWPEWDTTPDTPEEQAERSAITEALMPGQLESIARRGDDLEDNDGR